MKYTIEGNFNFYEELYKSLDDSSNNNNDDDKCLITNEPLIENYVTLECKHKFNYDALYKEIYSQKCTLRLYTVQNLSPNMYTIYKKSGKDYFIKCPYCRNIQFELLPDLNQDKYPKVYGINTYDKSYIRVEDGNAKGYKYKGYFYNMSKANKCVHDGCVSTICAFNDKFKFFCCSTHMPLQVSKRKLELKLQAKETKMKIKEEKEKIKQEKIKIKEEKIKNKKHVNTVIATNSEITEYIPSEEKILTYICSAILKTGLNKGHPCGSTIFCEGLCKRHFKLKKNTNSVDNKLELVDLDTIETNTDKHE